MRPGAQVVADVARSPSRCFCSIPTTFNLSFFSTGQWNPWSCLLVCVDIRGVAVGAEATPLQLLIRLKSRPAARRSCEVACCRYDGYFLSWERPHECDRKVVQIAHGKVVRCGMHQILPFYR
jgi:hypothetical protein